MRECAPDYYYDEENIPGYVYYDEESQTIYLNTLSFTYTFEHDNDTVFFSHFQPFTYSDLKDQIYILKKKYAAHIGSYFRIQELCKTFGGVPCFVITITENVQNQ